jgi:hypothetical protein
MGPWNTGRGGAAPTHDDSACYELSNLSLSTLVSVDKM